MFTPFPPSRRSSRSPRRAITRDTNDLYPRLAVLGVLFCFVLLIGGLAGCGGSDDEGGSSSGDTGGSAPAKGKQGGDLTFLAAADVDYLDPGQSYYTFGYQVLYATNRTLYAFAPGDKPFDMHLAQISITDERAQAVTFSEPYFESFQALLALTPNAITGATSIEDLKSYRLGAALNTTSLDFLENGIAPTTEPISRNGVPPLNTRSPQNSVERSGNYTSESLVVWAGAPTWKTSARRSPRCSVMRSV